MTPFQHFFYYQTHFIINVYVTGICASTILFCSTDLALPFLPFFVYFPVIPYFTGKRCNRQKQHLG